MGRPFLKMNGAGNDFVVVDALTTPFVPTAEQARAIADRGTGQGCDQLIAIEPSDRADAFMRVWNADGGVVETCGNALRCVGDVLMRAAGRDRVTIDTAAGPTVAIRAPDGQVRVDMGPPRLNWDEIPLARRPSAVRLAVSPRRRALQGAEHREPCSREAASPAVSAGLGSARACARQSMASVARGRAAARKPRAWGSEPPIAGCADLRPHHPLSV